MIADFTALTSTQWIIIIAIVSLCFSFSAWSILDCWKRIFESTNEKVLWIQICIFVPILGSLAYLFIGRKRGSKNP